MAVGIHNLGHKIFFDQLFNTLSMSQPTPTHLSIYLEGRDKTKEWKRSYEKKLTVKLSRSQRQKKSREEVNQESTDKSYGQGVGLTAGMKKSPVKKMMMRREKRCASVAVAHTKGQLIENAS
jgi:hypothetical protein